MMYLLCIFIFTLTWSSMQCSHQQWEVDFARNFAERRGEGVRNIIYPGTKWCGSGDNAANDDDLGEYEDTDKCCRTHDKCDDIMAPGATKNNIENKSSYTALNCKCDKAFYECLDVIDDIPSRAVGHLYFSTLESKCYEEENCVHGPDGVCQESGTDPSAIKFAWVKPKSFNLFWR